MKEPIKYFSVCDGIGAAHVAWKDLPFECVGTSEIEPFPAAVVDHHFGFTNYGDMTKLLTNQDFNDATINLLIGGTPCQSFSVAGLRAGLDDDRGNLALEFVRILYKKCIKQFIWENVPGVLSSNEGADFAAILSAWTGHDIAAQPFPESGIIEAATAENYSIAYRILDAQHFGVPQRRRRVFVIGYLGKDWRPPFAVLFERDSLRRDFTPRREKGQKPTLGATGSFEETGLAPTLTCKYGEQSGQDFGQPGLLVNQEVSPTVTSKWAKGSGGPAGDEVQNDVLHLSSTNYQEVIGTQCADDYKGINNQYVSDGKVIIDAIINDQGGDSINLEKDNLSPKIRAQSHQHEPVVIYGMDQSLNANEDMTNALMSSGNGQVQHGAVCYGMSGNLIGRSENAGPNGSGFSEDVSNTLTKTDVHGVVTIEPSLLTMREGCDGGGKGPLISTEKSATLATGNNQVLFNSEEVACAETADTKSVGANQTTGFVGEVVATYSLCKEKNTDLELSRPLYASDYKEPQMVVQSIARRLTPMECERLQGFPDNYTAILFKGKPASDGPRYKACGNSMATPVIEWLGERIVKVNTLLESLKND
jgi:DNA (cytosine-5)-methyltransferase 1